MLGGTLLELLLGGTLLELLSVTLLELFVALDVSCEEGTELDLFKNRLSGVHEVTKPTPATNDANKGIFLWFFKNARTKGINFFSLRLLSFLFI
jgi:hypothetical protein